jgi:tetratricopeptide (TPR) repeat protein
LEETEKPDQKAVVLTGTVSGDSFTVRAPKDSTEFEMTGSVAAADTGSVVKATATVTAKSALQFYRKFFYLIGAFIGLLLSALLTPSMVPKVYACFFLVLIPLVSLLVTVPLSRLAIGRGVKHSLSGLKECLAGASWTDSPAAGVGEVGLTRTQRALVALVACISSLILIFIIDQYTKQFWMRGEYQKVELISRPAVELTQLLLGPQNIVTVKCRFQLVEALRCEQIGSAAPKFKEPEVLYELNIQAKDGSLKGDPEEIANNLFSFGRVLDLTGRHTEADKIYRQAIEVWPKNSSLPNSLWLARALDRLAMLCLKEHKFGDAEMFEKQALDLDRALGKPAERSVGEDLNDMALVYDQQDKFEQAKKLYQESLDWKTAHAAACPAYSRATTLYNLAEIDKILGDQKGFENLSTEAYAIWKQLLHFRGTYSTKPNPVQEPVQETVISAPTFFNAGSISQSMQVPDPMDCYLTIVKFTKEEYETPHLNTRFDGLRPYTGRV